MNSIKLDIVTPLGSIKYDSVDYIRCPGLNGLFGIMANHQEGFFLLSIGEIKIVKNQSNEYLATSGGFAEINDGEVKFIVESIEKSSEIDLERAKNSLKRAQNRRMDNNQDMDYIRNEASLSRAMNRLKISKR